MLQIISGKFFAPETEIHQSRSTAVLYSNARLDMPFESAAGVLAPTRHNGPYHQYVFEYVQRMQKTTGKASLVRADDSTAVRQFANLLTVGMGAYFANDLASVQRHCAPIQSGVRLVRRHLDHSILVEPETLQSCRALISDCLGLDRRGFLTVSNCVAAISDALEALHTNADLAYALLVFGAECLSQRHDGYVPDWSHYPKQAQLDAHLSQVSDAAAEAIRHVLLSENQFRLTQRFIDFLWSRLRKEFFTTEARNVPQALRQSQVGAALAKVYNARSKYAHELQQIQHQLKVPQIAAGDVFHWYNEPFLTFNGLLRLVTHTLHTFVMNENKVQYENYNWRDNLAGVVRLFVAPQYVIFNETTVTPTAAWKRLEGFLSILCEKWSGMKNWMADIRPVLDRFATIFDQCTVDNKRVILLLVRLWDGIYKKHPLSPSARKLLDEHGQLLDECSIASLVAQVILEEPYPHSAAQTAATFTSYEAGRIKPNRPSLPHQIEMAMIIFIANRYFEENNESACFRWLDKGILECPGNDSLQHKLLQARESKQMLNPIEAIFPSLAKSELSYEI